MISSSPTYLLQRPSGLYFRKSVPAHLRHLLGREIKRPLNTRRTTEAKTKAQYLGAVVGQLFNHRSWQRLLVSLTDEQRKRVVSAWLTEKLEEYEAGLFEIGPLDEETKDEMVYAQKMNVSDAQERLYLQRFDHARPDLALSLSEAGLPAEHIADPRLLKLMLEAGLELEKRHLTMLLSGTAEGDDTSTLAWTLGQQQHAQNTPPGSSKNRSTEELVTEFLSEKEAKLTPKSLKEYKSSFDVLLEILDGKPLADLKRQGAIELRDDLLDYPHNRSKGQNQAKSLSQIKESPWRTISSTTANKHFIRWSSLASWAEKWDYLPKNYLEGLAPETEETARRAWNLAELPPLLEVIATTPVTRSFSWRYWLPLLGLATGARMDELCGLMVHDVARTETGTWYLNFENNEFRRLKNKQSRRMVPLHSWFVETGFTDFVRSQGVGLIFPDLRKYSTDKLSHEPSKWFGRVKSALGHDQEVNFHSFRHLMRNMLTEVQAQDSHIKSIIGHEQGDVTFGTYGDKLKPDVLKAHVEKLPIAKYLLMVPHHKELIAE